MIFRDNLVDFIKLKMIKKVFFDNSRKIQMRKLNLN